MDSFFGWVGGKKLLRNQICDKFPNDFNKYVEVFGGAGWVLFNKDKHAEFEVYNDINSELVNLFKCMKYHSDAIEKEMEYLLNSRQLFDEFVNMDLYNLTDIQRAVRYLYVVKLSYGCKMSTYGTKSRHITHIKNIESIRNRLKRVVIENRSFDKLILQYDRKDTLFYCDPPYYKAEKYYKQSGFKFEKEHHILLNNILSTINGRFVLSYNDSDFIKELYRDFNITEVSRNNNLIPSNSYYKELIITNY